MPEAISLLDFPDIMDYIFPLGAFFCHSITARVLTHMCSEDWGLRHILIADGRIIPLIIF